MEPGHVFIIAEIGSNHNQDISRAFELMDMARDAGADAVKFQSLRLDRVIAPEDISREDRDLFDLIKLEEGWYRELFAYADKTGIACLSTPTYLEAVGLLQECGAKYIKIASPQTYGFPALIKCVARSGMYTFMSTGYCENREISRAVNLYRKYGNAEKLVLMHCVSEYPTASKDVNLSYMCRLHDEYQVEVGYSDHTLGITAPVMAAAMGASVIEKHITVSRDEQGPDHFFALEPHEFRQMVSSVREAELMKGSFEKEITKYERNMRDIFTAYPYAARDILTGEKVCEKDISYYRSKTKGMSPWDVDEHLLGRMLQSDVLKGQKFK